MQFNQSTHRTLADDEYIVAPVIPYEDDLVHTDDYPCCSDMSCPCHTDQSIIEEIAGQVDDGLITAEQASIIFRGGQK